jgi:hypothetical protein
MSVPIRRRELDNSSMDLEYVHIWHCDVVVVQSMTNPSTTSPYFSLQLNIWLVIQQSIMFKSDQFQVQ